jgi:hypothetical protein
MMASEAATAFMGAHAAELAVGAGLVLASAAIGIGAATCVIVLLPEDYLQRPQDLPLWPDRPRWMRVTAKAGKNMIGAAVVAAGVVFMLPGNPAPGTVTVLAGLTLLDIPGKRGLERRILGQPTVLSVVNRVRRSFGRRPLRTG